MKSSSLSNSSAASQKYSRPSLVVPLLALAASLAVGGPLALLAYATMETQEFIATSTPERPAEPMTNTVQARVADLPNERGEAMTSPSSPADTQAERAVLAAAAAKLQYSASEEAIRELKQQLACVEISGTASRTETLNRLQQEARFELSAPLLVPGRYQGLAEPLYRAEGWSGLAWDCLRSVT